MQQPRIILFLDSFYWNEIKYLFQNNIHILHSIQGLFLINFFSKVNTVYRTRVIITRSWFETALDYKPRILGPTFLVYVIKWSVILTSLALKNGVKNIQTAGYNGARTIYLNKEKWVNLRGYFHIGYILERIIEEQGIYLLRLTIFLNE